VLTLRTRRVARGRRHTYLVHVTTVPMTLAFVRGQVAYMKERGFEVLALSSPGEDLDTFGRLEQVPVYPIEMTRRITPVRDLLTITRLVRYFRRVRPSIVHAHTPKGGLLGTIAAWLARVPVRIYHIRGLPFTSATGPLGTLLQWTERIACRLANRVLCVSESVRQVAVKESICPAKKIAVLGNGSGNGVDALGRFDPVRWCHTRGETRTRHAIPRDALVIGFVGRIVRQKGIVELFESWKTLREEFPRLHVLIVGFRESQDPLPADVEMGLCEDRRIHFTGGQRETPPLYAAMDLVVLPTYREGFPNVALEAASMELPIVITRVPGCDDAVVDNVTGTFVPPRDSNGVTNAVRRYLNHPELRAAHGTAGRRRVLDRFRQDTVWQALYAEYLDLLQHHGVPIPSDRGDVTPNQQHSSKVPIGIIPQGEDAIPVCGKPHSR
jgi:glycosyltransferase involved in cell wall biosynthesis